MEKSISILGLTGGIGSGKSSACEYFSQLGISIIDADQIAHQTTESNQEILDQITAKLGENLINQQGQLNRAKLREIIFNDPQARQLLESILHPVIKSKIKKQLEKLSKISINSSNAYHHQYYTVLAAPLLFETGLDKMVDAVLVIDLPESEQIVRVQKRDHSTTTTIEQIIATQMQREERLQKADYIISNTGTTQSLQNAVADLHKKIISHAHSDLHNAQL